MEIIDRINDLCRQNGTTIAKLEKELGYSNGSLAKAKDIPSSRIYEIAKRFNVSMEYIIAGKEVLIGNIDTDALSEIAMHSRILEYALRIAKLNESNQETIFNNIEFLEKKQGS